MNLLKLLKQFASLPIHDGAAIRSLLILCAFLAGTQTALAEVACPDRTASSSPAITVSQLANRDTARCTASGAPQNGILVRAYGNSCATGKLDAILGRSNGDNFNPDLITCDNCTAVGLNSVNIAPGTSAHVRAYFTAPDGTALRYDTTWTRSEADANGNYTCTLSNSTVRGDTFGPDATRPTATIGELTEVTPGIFTADITLSEESMDFTVEDLTVVNANAMLYGGGTNYSVDITPIDQGFVSLKIAQQSFHDAADNDNKTFIVNLCYLSTKVAGINGKITACLTPANETTGVPVSNTVLTMQFNQPMYQGTGNIIIKRVSDNSVATTINVLSNIVSFVDRTVSVKLDQELEGSTDYYVNIDNGALQNGNGNDFLVISDKTVWSFATVPAPQTVTLTDSSTRSGGGGSFDELLLVIMGLIGILIRYRMSQRLMIKPTARIKFVVATGMFSCLSGQVQADSPVAQHSILLGIAQTQQDMGDQAGYLTNLGYTNITLGSDKQAASGNIGYRQPLTGNWSLDLNYLHQGDLRPNVQATLPTGKTPIQAAQDIAASLPKRGDGLGITGVYHKPLGSGWNGQAGAGVFIWRSEREASVNNVTYTHKDNGISPVIHLGAARPLTPRTHLEIYGQHFFMPDTAVDRLGIGLAIGF